jgi:hypothetical protein
MHKQLGLLLSMERFYQSIDNFNTLKCFQAEETVDSLGDRRTEVTEIIDIFVHVININKDHLLVHKHSLFINN